MRLCDLYLRFGQKPLMDGGEVEPWGDASGDDDVIETVVRRNSTPGGTANRRHSLLEVPSSSSTTSSRRHSLPHGISRSLTNSPERLSRRVPSSNNSTDKEVVPPQQQIPSSTTTATLEELPTKQSSLNQTHDDDVTTSDQVVIISCEDDDDDDEGNKKSAEVEELRDVIQKKWSLLVETPEQDTQNRKPRTSRSVTPSPMDTILEDSANLKDEKEEFSSANS